MGRELKVVAFIFTIAVAYVFLKKTSETPKKASNILKASYMEAKGIISTEILLGEVVSQLRCNKASFVGNSAVKLGGNIEGFVISNGERFSINSDSALVEYSEVSDYLWSNSRRGKLSSATFIGRVRLKSRDFKIETESARFIGFDKNVFVGKERTVFTGSRDRIVSEVGFEYYLTERRLNIPGFVFGEFFVD